MDALCDQLNHLSCAPPPAPPLYLKRLTPHDHAVFATAHIPKDRHLGPVTGKLAYVWDILHHDYLSVTDDFVLDVSAIPTSQRSVLHYIRNENLSPNHPNVLLQIHRACPSEPPTAFSMIAVRDIQPGEEVVYMTEDFPYYY